MENQCVYFQPFQLWKRTECCYSRFSYGFRGAL